MLLPGLAAGVARPCFPRQARSSHARSRPAVQQVFSIAAPSEQKVTQRGPGLDDAEHGSTRHGRGLSDAGLPEEARFSGVDLGAEEEDDERVLTTFRWPAALNGKDVAVLGEARVLSKPYSTLLA